MTENRRFQCWFPVNAELHAWVPMCSKQTTIHWDFMTEKLNSDWVMHLNTECGVWACETLRAKCLLNSKLLMNSCQPSQKNMFYWTAWFQTWQPCDNRQLGNFTPFRPCQIFPRHVTVTEVVMPLLLIQKCYTANLVLQPLEMLRLFFHLANKLNFCDMQLFVPDLGRFRGINEWCAKI